MVSINRHKVFITPHITITFMLQSGYTTTPLHQPKPKRKGNQSISTDGVFTVSPADPVLAAVPAVSVVGV